MSRRELADAVNAHLHAAGVLDADVDANYVGKLERGVHRWPQDARRRAFRTVLSAASDQDLGFYIVRGTSGEESVSPPTGDGASSRRSRDLVIPAVEWLQMPSADASVSAPAGTPAIPFPVRLPAAYIPFQPAALDRPALDWLCDDTTASPIVRPVGDRRVDPEQVDAAMRQLQRLRERDHTFGAGIIGDEVGKFLDSTVRPLLTAGCDDAMLAERLHRVAIGAHELAGYQAVDLGADGLAQRHYLHALVLARRIGDRPFGGYLLGVSLGHLALHCGYPQRAIQMAQIAIRGLPQEAGMAVRAALWAVVARGHARLGDESACTAGLRNAHTCLHRSDTKAQPSWISYLTPVYLADEVAHCMFDLGHHDEARREVTHAVNNLDSGRVRRLAIDTALLASALARAGQVEEACVRGRQAVDLAARTGSMRAVQRVAQVHGDLIPFSTARVVAELIDYTRTVLPGALR